MYKESKGCNKKENSIEIQKEESTDYGISTGRWSNKKRRTGYLSCPS